MAAFLHVPEQHAGDPIELEDAVRLMADRNDPRQYGGDVDKMVAHRALAWRTLLSNLSTGNIRAYLQVPASGRYVRIPREYWYPLTRPEADAGEPDAPFRAYPEGHGFDPAMIGAPVLVWRHEIEEWVARLDAEVARLRSAATVGKPIEQAAAPAGEDKPKGRGGRPGKHGQTNGAIRGAPKGAPHEAK